MTLEKKKEEKVVIYTRVSTEDQAKEGFSLDAQRRRLESYCEARNWKIIERYIDEGYSGRNIKRPAYSKMINELKTWDILLVMKMDRIHRNSRNFMEMMDLIRVNNKEFVSMTESLDTSTAMGRFVVDIIQRIAQLKSEQIGERVYFGMEQKAQTPVKNLDSERSPYLGFAHPYGYDYRDGKLTINEKEIEIVKRIFSNYLAGSSIKELVNKLNEEVVETKNKRFWQKETIAKILKNPLYCGYNRWNGIIKKSSHLAIVDIETFNDVQSEIVSRIKVPTQKYRPLVIREP